MNRMTGKEIKDLLNLLHKLEDHMEAFSPGKEYVVTEVIRSLNSIGVK